MRSESQVPSEYVGFERRGSCTEQENSSQRDMSDKGDVLTGERGIVGLYMNLKV